MKKTIVFLLCGVMLLSLSACGLNTTATVPEALAAVMYPEAAAFDDRNARHETWEQNPVDDSFLAALSVFSGQTASAVLTGSEGNANYSPLSLYFALALAATGAGGETQRQLFDLLGVGSSAELSEQCSNLFRLLYKDNEISKLKLANSLWMDSDTVFGDAFVRNATENFYASSFPVDFADKDAGEAMGKWIADNTNGTITPDITTDPAQILSIINTVYFYDEWTNNFDKDNTAGSVFHADGGDVETKYMNGDISGGFTRGDNYVRASLSMKNGGQMVFILPDEGVSVSELVASPDSVNALFAGDETGFNLVTWQIPKFGFDCKYDDLADTLKALGVTDAFSPDADFSGLTDGMAYISGIIQQTHISVDEEGVEASAYTQIDYVGAGMPEDSFEMILDRPFVYGIKTLNGALLFIGICADPSE